MFPQIIKKLKATLNYSILATLVSLPLSLTSASALNTAYFTLTPNVGTFNVGDYLTLKVSENSGLDENNAKNQVNFVQANLNFDSSVLSFVSIDATQSGFTNSIQDSVSAGKVNMARGVLSDNGNLVTRTDEQLIAMVTFKITGAASSSSISFDASSAIKGPVGDTQVKDYWNGVTSGATFTFKAPAGPTNPNPSTPSGGNTGGSGSTSSGSKTTTTKTGTKAAATATVPGASSTPPVNATTLPVMDNGDHTQVLTPTTHMVSIKITNSKNKPVVGATVQFNGKTMHTISDGTVSFVDVADGNYTVSINYQGKTTKKAITVKGSGQPAGSIQNFNLKLASSKGLPTWIIYTAIGLAVLFIAAFFIPRGRPKMKHYATNPLPSGAVVVGGPTKPVAPIAPTPPPAPIPQPQPAAQPASSKKQTPVTPGTWFKPDNQSKDS